MLPFLLSGLSLGLAAGLSPGPMFALVVSQTLRHGLREGVRVAFAPLLSDLPIVLLSLYAVSRLASLSSALAWLGILGGFLVAWLGIDSLRAARLHLNPAAASAPPRSLSKAVAVNLFNPHVYLFWITVGAPLVLKGFRQTAAAPLAFLAAFYAALIGSKILLATFVSRSRRILDGSALRVVHFLLALALFVLAAWMIRSGAAALTASL